MRSARFGSTPLQTATAIACGLFRVCKGMHLSKQVHHLHALSTQTSLRIDSKWLPQDYCNGMCHRASEYECALAAILNPLIPARANLCNNCNPLGQRSVSSAKVIQSELQWPGRTMRPRQR